MTIPEDFPRDPWPAAVSGVQPKIAARKINGQFVIGLTPEELAVRYDNCTDLVVQLTAYCARKLKADPALNVDEYLPRVQQASSTKGWDVSPVEMAWIFSKVRQSLLSKLEQEARTDATETVRSVAHNMLLSGRPTSANATAALIEQETAAILEEKLLSKKEQK